VSSNLVNNLPAYLAVESAVPTGHTTQLLGALLGSNGGPLVLVWGSLATLLWRERCTARGLRIRPGMFAAVGLGWCAHHPGGFLGGAAAHQLNPPTRG